MPTRSDVKAGRVKPIVLTHTEPPVIVPPNLQINESDLHDMQEAKLTMGHPLLDADEIERLYGSQPQTHSLERTSPKGEGMEFIGTCTRCGRTNLTAGAALEPCSPLQAEPDGATLVTQEETNNAS